MKCYISNFRSDKEIYNDIKLLIPDATMRRRMSNVLKRSVATAVECMNGIDNIALLDAIITSSSLGLLADSEKFLKNVVDNEEVLINPTPFIQSTFNTVGAQIALLKHNNCYNVTFVNRYHPFEDALLDALFLIDDEKKNHFLIGHFDEVTPTLQTISKRLDLGDKNMVDDGSYFFHCTAQKSVDSIALLNMKLLSLRDYIDINSNMSEQEKLMCFGASTASPLVVANAYQNYNSFFPASATAFYDAVKKVVNEKIEMVLINKYPDNSVFVISVTNV